jgi:aminoglycoside 3-N-acetyltransferase
MADQTISKDQVLQQLLRLGIEAGDVLLVHTSFSEVKPVEDGPLGLIAALTTAVGPKGTLVMPSMTDDDDTSFDPQSTPCEGMGVVADTFWRLPGVLRSDSPHAFAALGPHAAQITAPHPVDLPHGPDSPVARVHELGGQVLLLGVGHDANTTVHLAEYLAGVRYRRKKTVTLLIDGRPSRIDYGEIDHCCENFNLLDGWLAARGLQRRGKVGHAETRLARSRDIVDVVAEQVRANETVFLHPRGVDEQCDEARESLTRAGVAQSLSESSTPIWFPARPWSGEMREMAPPAGLTRPTTMTEMLERTALLRAEENMGPVRAFQPRPTDVFISPVPKCGTTWLQQIVHGLRTGGSMDFDEISQVIPFVERAFLLGTDLDAPQPALPRAFKSHLSWNDIPKGARYIIAVRDPKDALVSLYRFLEGWQFERGSISMTTFAREVLAARRVLWPYWGHLASWWEHRNDANVLLLCYEDMKEDLPRAVQAIAGFIGCRLDEALLDCVTKQSSIEFMRAHNEKFDGHILRGAIDKLCGFPPGGRTTKVRNGRVGEHLCELPRAISDEMDRLWREEIETKLALSTYQALRDQLALEKEAFG